MRRKGNVTNCLKCNVDLVVGDNWNASQKKSNNYTCKLCHTKNTHANPNFKNIVNKYQDSSKGKITKQKSRESIEAGIYGIFYDCKLVYIGESRTPAARKHQHYSVLGIQGGKSTSSKISEGIGNGEIQRDKLRFKMFEFIDDTAVRKSRESALIQRYKPIYNEKHMY